MRRVLVVDDTEDILNLAERVAQALGFTVATLSNTLQFMTTFVRFKPDIVLLDVVMPNIDGIEIIRWLSDVDYTGRLVIMSGFADYQRLAEAMADASQRMVVGSLPKPFRLDELRAALIGGTANH
jgi:DNA-binding NtrC family response regulator